MPPRIVIFAKAPVPGRTKTRLIPALGAAGAARLAERMLRHTITEAIAAMIGEVELCVAPAPDARAWQSGRDAAWPVDWQRQGPGNLGTRLARAARRTINAGCPALLIGADSPALDRIRLREAAAQLQAHDAVLVPSLDGGYALLGLNAFDPSLFHGIAWSTEHVASATLEHIDALSWTVAVLPPLRDIDTAADLEFVPESIRVDPTDPLPGPGRTPGLPR